MTYKLAFNESALKEWGLLWKGERGGAQRAPAGADEQTAAGVLAVGGARGAGGARPGHDAVSRHS